MEMKSFFSVVQNTEISGNERFNLLRSIKNQISKNFNSTSILPTEHKGPIFNLSIDLVEQQ